MNPRTEILDRRPTDGSTVDLSITIEAPIDVVFDFLVVPEQAFRWMGIEGEIDPRPGGRYRVRYSDDDVAVGEYLEVVRPTVVSWSWGWEGSETIPPGSSTVTFSLAEDDGRTTVTVVHSGLPTADDADKHTQGWSYWVRRLAVASVGGDPSTVPFDA